MAATHLLLCLTICLITPGVCQTGPKLLYRRHVSEVGGSVTAYCPPHGTYSSRQWVWSGNLLRPTSVIYRQQSGGAVDASRARPDMVLNPDWSITVGSLQVQDTGWLWCDVDTAGGQLLGASTGLVVYSEWREARVGTSVTLQCPVDAAGYTTRAWYTRPWSSSYLLYKQTTTEVTEGPKARADMSLDVDSFELTLGEVRQEDFLFSCLVTRQTTTTASAVFPAVYGVVLDVAEGASAMLPCGRVKELTTQSTESYTRTWQRVNGDLFYLQYRWEGVFYERRPAVRPDMALSNETFSLTIGSVQLQDDTMFVCTFDHPKGQHVESVKLQLYINPKIIFSGLDEAPVSAGTTLTVTCTINRVYPALGPDDFYMRWGTQTTKSTESKNNDRSYRYTVQYTRMVNEDANGTVVECLVKPTKGQSDSKSMTIILSGRDVLTSPPDIGHDSPPVTGGLSPSVIGGAAAAATVVISVVIITACVCVRRRKAKLNKVTDQTRRTSGGRVQGAPDVTRRDETYLPGADYHQYEVIPAPGDAATGVVPAHSRHHIDTGSYLHPPGGAELILAAPAVPPADRQYEKLRPTVNTTIDKWLKNVGITKTTRQILKRHNIVTVQDLQDMSRADMVEAGLNVGDRNKIRRALKEVATSQF